MRVIQHPSDYFACDGRGPTIIRFLHDTDFIVKGSFLERRRLPGSIIGVEYYWYEHPDIAWVLFQKAQVVQIVPEEVCSYWFLEHLSEKIKSTGIFRVEDSIWMSSFNQRHLRNHKHFILEFYDDIIETISEDLVFGRGKFRIEDHPELSYYR